MILDNFNEFCDDTSLNTGAAATYNIGDVINLGLAGRDIGNGEPLYLVIQVGATGIKLGSSTGTIQFQLVSDDSGTPSTSTATVHLQTPEFATSTSTDTTTLAPGTTLFAVALPMHGNTYEQYLGIQQITGTTAISAGNVNAFLTHDVAKWKAYADAL